MATDTVDDLKNRDLSPTLVARESAPKPTWFVERMYNPKAGEIIAVEEKEAWDMLNNASNWKRRDFKFIGYSDGKMYQKIIKESMASATRLLPEIERLKKEIGRYRNLEDKMMLDEVVDMEDTTDPVNAENIKKILRLRSIVDRYDAELEKVEAEYRSVTRDVIKTATEAEIKIAKANWKKHKTWPNEDINIITPTATPKERKKILKNMNG